MGSPAITPNPSTPPPPPPGFVPMNGQSAGAGAPPPPAGFVPMNGTNPPDSAPPAPDGWTRIKTATTDFANNLSAPMVDTTKGVVKGGMHTVAGLLNILGSGRQAVMDAQQQQNVRLGRETQQEAQAVPKDAIAGHIKDAADWLNAHAQDHGMWQHIGDFGESALELMTPEALAGLVGDAAKVSEGASALGKAGEVAGKAQQMADAAKVAKTLDAFPRIKALVMIGAKAAAKAGAEVGAQTYVKTGGDADAALTAGGEAAVAGGIGAPALTVAGSAAGLLADKLRKPAAVVTPEMLGKLDEVLNSVGPAGSKEATGAAVGKTVDKLKQVAAEHANAAYNPLKGPLGLAEDATRDEILKAAQKAAEPGESSLLDAAGKPVTTPGDGGKALADLRKADAAYGASRETIDRALVKKIAEPGARPELVHDYIAKASLDDMRTLLPSLDAPTRAAVARNVMQDIVAKGGEPENFNADAALKALGRLDKDGAKSSMLFGDTASAALKKNLQEIAAATRMPSGKADFNAAVKYVGHYAGAAIGAEAGYEAGGGRGAIVGGLVGGLGGSALMRTIVANPKIAQNLLFAIQSGARPERYGPLIGAMIQQANTTESKDAAASELQK